MRSRYSRRATPASGFFAFQDIITGTTGFLIMIAVFLALNLDDSPTLSTEGDAPDLRESELADLAARIAVLKEEVKGLQTAPVEDEASLQRSIEALKASILRLTSATPSSEEETSTKFDLEAKIERQKLLTKIENLKRSQAESTRRVADAAVQLAAAEQLEKDAQAQLIQTRERRNVMKVLPERSDTGKEPVIVMVKQVPWLIQRFDRGDVHTAYSIQDLLANLKPLSPQTHYLVFFFKPSGAAHFESITNRARQAGYEIGYDLIQEGTEIELSKERK
ncbi:hypothetical protein WJU23_02215 [Prosthecobacter sp. SYSU 5D2]|uniref:hypothetical protein n=1 Tax=Prosthecobacter sp. SYSU 5D2 TaxID=3134134 RepID=UPI0031FEEF75